MPHLIELPHVGESVTEAVIQKWLKKPGDRIEKYDAIVEVVTDKVTMEVPAPTSGTLTRITAAEGQTVQMGSVIAEMEPDAPAQLVAVHDSQAARASGRAHEQAAPLPPAADRIGQMVMGANVGPTGGVFQDTSLPARSESAAGFRQAGAVQGQDAGLALYSPVVLRLAAQIGIDLSELEGTGLGGRVTKKDVLVAAQSVGGKSRGTSAPGTRGRGSGDAEATASPSSEATEDRIIDPSPVRRMIAAHMVRSVTEIPHAWSAVEVDVTGMVECRAANREKLRAATGVELTYLAFTLHAVAHSLRANPLLNSSWEGGRVRLKGRVNVGIAVAGAEGLVVPVVHDADRETVAGLAKRLAPVIARARDGKLNLDDVQGGTFTLNNTGALGSVIGGAIINHPQAAILTTEAIMKRPVVVAGPKHDAIAVHSVMNICLSFDHRVIDGAEAAAFMQDVKKRLEAIHADTPLG